MQGPLFWWQWPLTAFVVCLWAYRFWQRNVPSLYAVPVLLGAAWSLPMRGFASDVVFLSSLVAYVVILFQDWPPRGDGKKKTWTGFRERMTDLARAAFRREAGAAA